MCDEKRKKLSKVSDGPFFFPYSSQQAFAIIALIPSGEQLFFSFTNILQNHSDALIQTLDLVEYLLSGLWLGGHVLFVPACVGGVEESTRVEG